jgi:ATP-dependent protease HslVU (ClpYQ) peptidase subunit
MSIAVGLECKSGVWLGWDSAIVNSAPESSSLDAIGYKGFIKNGIGFVSVGSPRVAQLLKYELVIKDVGDDFEGWIVKKLSKEIKRIFKKHEYAEGITMLVANDREVHYFFDDHACYRSSYGYAAVGSGSDQALGAIAALTLTQSKPQDIVRVAVEITAKHSHTVTTPAYTAFIPRRK